jgi:hypothetical protein
MKKELSLYLVGAGAIVFGFNPVFEALNNHFNSVQKSEETRIRQDRERLMSTDYEMGSFSLPKIETPEDTLYPQIWERPTDWNRKVKK